MTVVGLTGGIGSGKSTVSGYLISKNIEVIDADKIAREIVGPGSKVLEQLAKIFGQDILLPDGSLDRKKLGSIVFRDNQKREILNKITHHEIIGKIKSRIKEAHSKIVVVDAPLLIETGLNQYVDEVWVVDVDDKIRIDRLINRDRLSESEIQERINSQLPREERLKYAKVILDNSGSLDYLLQQIDKQIERLT